MSTQIEIICYTIDKENFYILSENAESKILPNIVLDKNNIDINNLDINFYLENIISKYTNINIEWINPVFIDIKIYPPTESDSDIKISIYYGCYIPYSGLKDGSWVSLDKETMYNPIIKKLLCLK